MPRPHLAARLAITGLALGLLALASPTASAEGPSSATGRLEVLHEDHFAAGLSVHRYLLLAASGERTELLFDDRGPEGLGGLDVRVTGTAVRPGVMHVASSAAVAETGTASGSTAVQSAGALITKKVAVILLDFSDSVDETRQSVSPATAGEAVFSTATSATPSVNLFLKESSFSQLKMVGFDVPEGDVFGWVKIGARSTDACDFDEWGRQARAAAVTSGFNDADYDQVIHLMPSSTCRFGGVAYMPGKYSWTVLRPPSPDVVDPLIFSRLRSITSHEYGHSLGIHHAGAYSCTSKTGAPVRLSSSCTLAEYGDPFSVMGVSRSERQFHGYQKGRLGWLAAANTTTVTASGFYPLAAVSSVASGPQVLRIARPRIKGQAGDYFYVELRGATGFADAFGSADPVVNGLSIRLAPDYGTNAISKLLDMTPATSSFDDAALPVNDTFTDPATGIAIRLDVVGGGSATVHVTVPTSGNRK